MHFNVIIGMVHRVLKVQLVAKILTFIIIFLLFSFSSIDVLIFINIPLKLLLQLPLTPISTNLKHLVLSLSLLFDVPKLFQAFPSLIDICIYEPRG